ncbi:MAG TPA: hypothetical protein VIK40_03390 [Geomonas sp.]
MRSRTRPAAVFALLLFAAAAFLAGCATGIGKTAAMTATLQSVEDDYHQAQLQTAATEEALSQLVLAEIPDLKQSFYFYSSDVDKMEQIGKRLVTHADGMYLRGTYYFVESAKTLESCAYPRGGRAGDGQSIDLGENFNAVSEAGGEVKRAFRAYQFDIEQIRDSLACHLTPAGIETIEPILSKAKVDGNSLQETLQQALDTMERAKAAMPPAPGKTAGTAPGSPTPTEPQISPTPNGPQPTAPSPSDD